MARDTGNGRSQARSLSIAARTKSYTETVGGNDRADFFRFRLSARSTSTFSLSALRDNADLALLNSRGGVIRQSRLSGTATERISETLNAGVYFLRVTPRTAQDSTRYRLQYRATAAPSPSPTPTPRNTNPTIAATGASIVRGTAATLNSNLLSASDAEQPTGNLVYTLTTLPQSGSLLFNNEVITAPDRTFTQADIAAGRLSYVNRGSARPLATTTVVNRNPQISGTNVVWEGSESGGDSEILYSNGDTTRPITTNSVDDVNVRISGTNVVWQEGTGSDARILLLQGINNPTLGTPVSLIAPDPTTDNRNPVISGVNVAWQARGGSDRGNDFEIFFYNGSFVQQLTNNNTDDVNVQISGANLAWQNENVGVADSEIFFYNGSTVRQLTDNTTDDLLPQISGSNVVWLNETTDTTSTIFFTTVGGATTSTPIALTAAGSLALNPQISGSNVVWQSATTAASPLELFFSDIGNAPPVPLTSNSSASNVTPSISGSNVVWTRADSTNSQNTQIFLGNAARQDSFGFTVSDGAGGSTAGVFNFTIG